MALGDLMRKTVRVTVEGRLSPRQLGIVAGTAAKTRHEQLMSEGIVPQNFQRFVNGTLGAPETSLRFTAQVPGEIVYKGSSIAAAAIFALQLCRQLSPVRSGAYSRAWVLAIDGLVWTAPLEQLPASASEVTIVNYAPYSRRLEQSYGRKNPAYHVTQIAVDTTKRRFGGLTVRRQFVTLSSISNSRWQVPYVLKRPPGGQMLYPAVVIRS
jgi:hypothetical protein